MTEMTVIYLLFMVLCALSAMLLCVHTCGCGGKLPAHVLFFLTRM